MDALSGVRNNWFTLAASTLPAPGKRNALPPFQSGRWHSRVNGQWQWAVELLLAETDVGAVSKAVELVLFYDAKLDCRGVLDVGQCIDHLFGELNCGRLRGPDRECPKTGGLHSRDRLVVQAPNFGKPSSGPLFESLNQVPLVFHGTRSHAHGALDALMLFQRANQARRGTTTRKPGKARNQIQRAGLGADGETGDFKGLTLSNSGPGFLKKTGFSLRHGADRVKRPDPPRARAGSGLAATH
jgi:hypothetical protein